MLHIVLPGLIVQNFWIKILKVYTQTDQFYTSSDAAVQAVNEAYTGLTFTSGTANPLWVFGDVASDDAASGNPGASPDAATIDNFSYSATNSHLSNEWNNFYEGITNCNLVLANVPSISMDTATSFQDIRGSTVFKRLVLFYVGEYLW